MKCISQGKDFCYVAPQYPSGLLDEDLAGQNVG
jgi:hypothetical protein